MTLSCDVVGPGPRLPYSSSPWLSRPLSQRQVYAAVTAIIASLPVLVAAIGGPTMGDANLSVYTTWLVAHGDLACAYPASLASAGAYTHSVLAAPLYPLAAAIVSFAFRVGSAVPFPSAASMGPGCVNTHSLVFAWAHQSGAIEPTLWIGIGAWFALVVATLAYLRSDGVISRGRMLAVVAVAYGAPIYSAYRVFFHPQDILAIALILWSMTMCRRERFVVAGMALGLGLLCQQFVVLAVVALVVVASRSQRRLLLTGTIISCVPIATALLFATSGSALWPLLVGSDRVLPTSEAVTSTGGSLLWELHLSGPTSFIVVRLAPVVVTALVARWARRRFGPATYDFSRFAALIGLAFALRLVFEQNMFSYYFAALFVMFAIVAVTTHGRIDLIALWMAFDVVAFNPLRRIYQFGDLQLAPSYDRLPAWALVVILAALIITNLRERRVHLYQPATLLLVLITAHASLWGTSPALAYPPRWWLQLLLVPSAIALLLSELRSHAATDDSSIDRATLSR